MTFNIQSLSAANTIDIEIIDPRTGEPLIGEGGKPCSVTTYSPGSKEYAAEQSRASNRAVKRLRQKGRADTTPEEDIAAKATFLTGITRSFNNFVYGEGLEGADMFRAAYSDVAMGWLTDQVNAGAGDWGNSLGSPSN